MNQMDMLHQAMSRAESARVRIRAVDRRAQHIDVSFGVVRALKQANFAVLRG